MITDTTFHMHITITQLSFRAFEKCEVMDLGRLHEERDVLEKMLEFSTLEKDIAMAELDATKKIFEVGILFVRGQMLDQMLRQLVQILKPI